MKTKSVVMGLIVFSLMTVLFFRFQFLLPYFFRPQLVFYYLTKPAMRDLMHAVAQERSNTFHTFWDNETGVSLSKNLFYPVRMDGKERYAYRPNITKLSFMTGVKNDQHKFEAVDSPQLRNALKKLDTTFLSQTTLNAYGYRQTRFDFSKDCQNTIYFAGDSFTEGLWVNDDETYVNHYMQLLSANTRGKICAVNAGVNGYGIFEESWKARQDYKVFKYKVLFLFVYANDIHDDVLAVLRGDLDDFEMRWQVYLDELTKLAAFAKQNEIRVIVVPLPPKEQSAMVEGQRHYQEKLQHYCKQLSMEFWDPLEVLLNQHLWEEVYFDWDPHFNDSGHKILAKFLWQRTQESFKDGLFY